ncbi:hypothetical protein ATR01nite_30530 [Acetobacter tropicalis]|uniref:Uncharacterized protein n=1 Tax=Acetobacter tropicalis TaxID=104102 RepID=A0A511FSP1_9PROT|nr:hypothetical protein ATR01nite_30530 [Acetobacter tropicalis]
MENFPHTHGECVYRTAEHGVGGKYTNAFSADGTLTWLESADESMINRRRSGSWHTRQVQHQFLVTSGASLV